MHVRQLVWFTSLLGLCLMHSPQGWAQLVLSEVHASDDWIEIRNDGSEGVALFGHGLADDMDAASWLLGSGFLGPGERVVIYPAAFQISPGEAISLWGSDGELLDAVPVHPHLPAGHAVGRPEGSDTGWCVYTTPTPGENNNASMCHSGILDAPQLTVPAGFYEDEVLVQLSNPDGGTTVRYTLNGASPTVQDPVFPLGGLGLDVNTSLKVKAWPNSGSMLPSPETSSTYFLNDSDHDLAVVNLMAAPDDLFDQETGIYALGNNAEEDYPYFGANFWEPWSKPASLQAFDANGDLVAQEGLDLEIHGGWSRAEPQKSFRLDFKGMHSGDLDWAVFPQKPEQSQFNNLNLRNGGQHVWGTKIQDAVLGDLASETHIVSTAWRPLELYLNSEYWGIYAARDKSDEHFVAAEFGVSPDDVTLLNPQGALAGNAASFNAVTSALLALPPNASEFRGQFESAFNVMNYIDYFTVETFCQNMDWMGIAWGLNNTKVCKPSSNHKWHYILYDTDACLGYWGTSPWENYVEYARNPGWPSPHSELFNHMLNNPGLRRLFINRYADLVNTLFQPEAFEPRVEAAAAWIAPSMPRHIERWGAPASMSSWENALNNMVSHEAQRVGTSRIHLTESFGLDGQRTCTLDVFPPASGHIKINTIVPEDLPWEGVYFGGNAIDLTPVAETGHMFDRWDINPHSEAGLFNVEDRPLEVDMFTSDLFRARFVPCPDLAEATLVTQAGTYHVALTEVPFVDSISWSVNGVHQHTGLQWTPTASGSLQAHVHFDGCVVEAQDNVQVGISSEAQRGPLRVWPNPAQDLLHIDSPTATCWATNSQGQLHGDMTSGTFDVSGWAAGVYHIHNGTHTVSVLVNPR